MRQMSTMSNGNSQFSDVMTVERCLCVLQQNNNFLKTALFLKSNNQQENEAFKC